MTILTPQDADKEPLVEAVEGDNQNSPSSKTDEIPGTNVRSNLNVVLSQEALVQKKFCDPMRIFLIVEDDSNKQNNIVKALKKVRGTGDQDAGIIPVRSVQSASVAIDSLVKEGGASIITVILDMAFPFSDDSSTSDSFAGLEVKKGLCKKVNSWNESHKDKPITVEIIMNSTIVKNLEEAKKLGAVAFSPDKDNVIETLTNYFEQQSS